MLKSFINGSIMTDLPNHLLEEIGKDTATLHNIKPPDFLREIMWCGIERFSEVEQYALNSSFDLWLKRTSIYINNHITSDLPKAFIHSDIFASNIIVNDKKSKATIMDFEEASYYYRLFDIAILIISLCSRDENIDFLRTSLILKGYNSINKLIKAEKQALQPLIVYAAAGVAFWRHKNFNYIAPDNNLKDSYLKMKNLADNVVSSALRYRAHQPFLDGLLKEIGMAPGEVSNIRNILGDYENPKKDFHMNFDKDPTKGSKDSK